MSLARPIARITLDGRTLTSAEAALARAEVRLTILGSHDAATLVAWPRSKLADATVGSALALALGDGSTEEDVWGGEVTAVGVAPDSVMIDGLAATAALSRQRVSRTYSDMTVEDVVRDLAGEVDINEVSGTTNLAAYAVDDRRTVWAHLAELAAFVGADLGSSPAGALRFVPARAGAADHVLRHGAELLHWSAGPGSVMPVPAVAAYGAGSEAGAEQWHWVLREPSPVGDGPVSVVPGVSTRDAAEAMARGLADRGARGAVRGRLVARGDPTIRPGDLLDARDLPDTDPGTLRVLEVTHLLDGRLGFVSVLTLEGAGR
jgi:hypothetical protein